MYLQLSRHWARRLLLFYGGDDECCYWGDQSITTSATVQQWVCCDLLVLLVSSLPWKTQKHWNQQAVSLYSCYSSICFPFSVKMMLALQLHCLDLFPLFILCCPFPHFCFSDSSPLTYRFLLPIAVYLWNCLVLWFLN